MLDAHRKKKAGERENGNEKETETNANEEGRQELKVMSIYFEPYASRPCHIICHISHESWGHFGECI